MSNESKKPIYKKWWFWVIIIVLLIVIVGGSDTEQGIQDGFNDAMNTTNDTVETGSTTEESEADKNSKEQYANLENILDTVCPYGYSLSLFDYKEINTTETFTVYSGYITIENAYGNKAKQIYTVRYSLADNSVEQIVVNGESIYEK